MPSGFPVTGFLIGSMAAVTALPIRTLLSRPRRSNRNGTNCGSSTLLKVVTMISNGIPPACPDAICRSASRWRGSAFSSKKRHTVPFPLWIASGQCAAKPKARPSRETSPYRPRLIRHAPTPWQ